jgi:hypothetical protein
MEGVVPITLRGVMGSLGRGDRDRALLRRGPKENPRASRQRDGSGNYPLVLALGVSCAMASKPKQPAGPPMAEPSDTPDENEMRRQDCQAKAGYCKWVASISPDEKLRKVYAQLSEEWEKEATK